VSGESIPAAFESESVELALDPAGAPAAGSPERESAEAVLEPPPPPAPPPAPELPAVRAGGDPFAFLDDLMAGADEPVEGDDPRHAPPGPSTRRRGIFRDRRPHHDDEPGDIPMEAGADAFGVPPGLGDEGGELAEAGRRRFLNRIREEALVERPAPIPDFRGDRALDDAIYKAVAPTILAVPGVTAPMPGTMVSRFEDDDMTTTRTPKRAQRGT
jgi:hypothetical protein